MTASTPKAAVTQAARDGPTWVHGLFCGVLIAVAPAIALLLAGLLAPAGLALMFDPRPKRALLRPLLMSGLSMSIAPALTCWHGGMTVAVSLSLLSDPSVLAPAWAAQGANWLVLEVSPVVIRLVLDGRSLARAAWLRNARARYEADWGIPPAVPASTGTLAPALPKTADREKRAGPGGA